MVGRKRRMQDPGKKGSGPSEQAPCRFMRRLRPTMARVIGWMGSVRLWDSPSHKRTPRLRDASTSSGVTRNASRSDPAAVLREQ